jgi:hypothetical protein
VSSVPTREAGKERRLRMGEGGGGGALLGSLRGGREGVAPVVVLDLPTPAASAPRAQPDDPPPRAELVGCNRQRWLGKCSWKPRNLVEVVVVVWLVGGRHRGKMGL